ncbi:MAG: helix-hairpin-helix domain-containing protein [Clostridiales Family XIII bacterium]|jgi:competence protein ComEA|nr:helix-hairpin-helix domain-containing protein [Clostridiales Family XIII bacterium]
MKKGLLEAAIAHKSAVIKVSVAALLLAAGFSAYAHKLSEGKEGIVIASERPGVGAASGVEPGGLRQGTPEEVEATDGAAAGQEQKEPQDSERQTIVVDVAGAVSSPTVLVMPSGSRLYEALDKAGGVTEDADLRQINRAVELADGDRIYIPTREETRSAAPLPPHVGADSNTGLSDARGVPKASGAPPSEAGSASAPAAAAEQININTAGPQELQRLNGVGPSTAEKIIAYRQKNGGFKKIDDIKKVSGIGAKTFEKLKDKITV